MAADRSATRERTMEQRLSVVTLGVADLERSRRFYGICCIGRKCYNTWYAPK
jgi:hypothetical protein